MKIALVQSKPIAGDLKGNLAKIKNYIKSAEKDRAELIVFSEGSLTGLNIKGLVYDSTFRREAENIKEEIIKYSENIDLLIPIITEYRGNIFEYQTHISKGRIIKSYPSTPNETHEIFGEDIEEAQKECILKIKDKVISLNCPNGDADLNIYSFISVFDKNENHIKPFMDAMPETDIPYINLNSAGFCNGLCFSGGSFGVSQGKITYLAPYFEENYSLAELSDSKITGPLSKEPKEGCEAIYGAITNSIKDFAEA
ncbi:MAG: hypothetical protein KBT47_04285, partial [Armatimonadetes bacterium]|nr:hypothetical protein [Candidatus Hippobium faecium]